MRKTRMDMRKTMVLGMTLAAALAGSRAVAVAADAKSEQFLKAAMQGTDRSGRCPS